MHAADPCVRIPSYITSPEGHRENALGPRSDVPACLTFRVNTRAYRRREGGEGGDSTSVECVFSIISG